MISNNSKTPSQLLFKELAINLDEVPIDRIHHYIAVEYFLKVEDEPDSDVNNLERVNRYLESFHLTGDNLATKLVGSGIEPKSLAENRGVYEV
jgi:hypothetical protein